MTQRWYSTNGFLLIRELKHLTPETCALSTVPLARTVTDGYEWNLDIYDSILIHGISMCLTTYNIFRYMHLLKPLLTTRK